MYVHMLLMQRRGEHVSLEEFGRLVSREQSRLGGGSPSFSASTVSRWESGESEPDGVTFRALSAVVKGTVGPGWVHYGPDSSKGPKDIDLGAMGSILDARASGRRVSRR